MGTHFKLNAALLRSASIADVFCYVWSNLTGVTFNAILHSTMVPHIHLIFLMASPAKVFNSIVCAYSIVMGNIREVIGIWDKGNCHNSMDKFGVNFRRIASPKWNFKVSLVKSLRHYRRLTWLTAALSRRSIAPYKPSIGDFVIVKAIYLAPFNGVYHG